MKTKNIHEIGVGVVFGRFVNRLKPKRSPFGAASANTSTANTTRKSISELKGAIIAINDNPEPFSLSGTAEKYENIQIQILQVSRGNMIIAKA